MDMDRDMGMATITNMDIGMVTDKKMNTDIVIDIVTDMDTGFNMNENLFEENYIFDIRLLLCQSKRPSCSQPS